MTLSLKNTIATLALLVAIFMMSGCGALNSLAEDAKDALDDLDLDNIDGFSDLSEDDPCLKGNALFTSESCNGEENRRVYNNLREASCIQDNNFRCANTTTRICVTEERLNNVLCIGALYDLLRAQRDERLEAERQSVVIADWTDGTNEDGLVDRLNVEPNSAHTGNQFLSGLHGLGALPTSNQVQGSGDALTPEQRAGVFTISNRSDRGTLTLAYTQEHRGPTHPVFHGFKGISDDGDETNTGDVEDGVVFVSGLYLQQTGCEGDLCSINRHYAGLLPTTDLGAPLTESLAQGTWHGWIKSRGDVSYNQRFDLTITFDESTKGGTIAAYVADATVADATTALKIDGVFNNHGFVTGDILHGDRADDNQIGDNKSPGQLRGLIGDEGAVVAFISDATGPKTDDAPAQYSGGFVAYLPNPGTTTESGTADPCVANNTCVDYAHWLASPSQANPADAPTPDRFLKGTSRGLMGVNQRDIAGFANLVNPNLSRAGDPEDGYAFYRPNSDSSSPVHNIGIFSTTNLGAPLSERITTAQWPGVLHHRAGTSPVIIASRITLTVDFRPALDTGTIDGTNGIIGGSQYQVNAAFDENGVIIRGTVFRRTYASPGGALTGTSTGIISGLIGAEGVVGVFRSNAGQTPSYVGGFLAQPPLEITVDYAHWVATAVPTDRPTPYRFLKGTSDGLMEVARSDLGAALGLPGVPGSGIAIYRPDKEMAIHNVGMFSTTNLGEPLSDNITNAEWLGTFLDRSGTSLIIPRLVTLTVSFNGTTGEITGRSGEVARPIPSTIDTSGLGDYAIDADFNAAGVISGTITHTAKLPGSNTLTGGNGTVSGLIGVKGAVGVFHSNLDSRTSFVGGFVASPPASGS